MLLTLTIVQIVLIYLTRKHAYKCVHIHVSMYVRTDTELSVDSQHNNLYTGEFTFFASVNILQYLYYKLQHPPESVCIILQNMHDS